MIQGCRDGSRRHQQALYELFSRKMYGVCVSYMTDRDAAMDVLHDAFMKIFKSIGNYESLPQLEAWTRKVVVHTAIDHLRRRKKLLYIEQEEGSVLEKPEDSVNHKIDANDVNKIVEMLPAGARAVFNLYALEGYNHREIAEQLNISEGTSKSQLSRARELLRGFVNVHYQLP